MHYVSSSTTSPPRRREPGGVLAPVYPQSLTGTGKIGVVVAMTDLDMQLRADDSAPRLSRVRLDEIADELGSRLIDVKLVVSELVTNSVRHADKPESVQVKVRVDDAKIRVEVVDEGPGFTLDSQKHDGLGLTIVERLAQDWGVSVDGTCTVWAEMSKSIGEDGD